MQNAKITVIAQFDIVTQRAREDPICEKLWKSTKDISLRKGVKESVLGVFRATHTRLLNWSSTNHSRMLACWPPNQSLDACFKAWVNISHSHEGRRKDPQNGFFLCNILPQIKHLVCGYGTQTFSKISLFGFCQKQSEDFVGPFEKHYLAWSRIYIDASAMFTQWLKVRSRAWKKDHGRLVCKGTWLNQEEVNLRTTRNWMFPWTKCDQMLALPSISRHKLIRGCSHWKPRSIGFSRKSVRKVCCGLDRLQVVHEMPREGGTTAARDLCKNYELHLQGHCPSCSQKWHATRCHNSILYIINNPATLAADTCGIHGLNKLRIIPQ